MHTWGNDYPFFLGGGGCGSDTVVVEGGVTGTVRSVHNFGENIWKDPGNLQ